jgi:hypothetical protein
MGRVVEPRLGEVQPRLLIVLVAGEVHLGRLAGGAVEPVAIGVVGAVALRLAEIVGLHTVRSKPVRKLEVNAQTIVGIGRDRSRQGP